MSNPSGPLNRGGFIPPLPLRGPASIDLAVLAGVQNEAGLRTSMPSVEIEGHTETYKFTDACSTYRDISTFLVSCFFVAPLETTLKNHAFRKIAILRNPMLFI